MTGASVHDSQVAIPLDTMSFRRVTYCYELMDAAYHAREIREHSQAMGHVAIIEPKALGGKRQSIIMTMDKMPRQLSWAERERYKERTVAERVNARLKGEFGGRHVRVRGAAKVMARLTFGMRGFCKSVP